MSKHYITGVAGFVGSNLARRLCEYGHEVVGMDSLVCGFMENISDLFELPNFEFIKGDIRDVRYCGETYDYIWHFAARGEVYWCKENPRQAVDVNVNGTIKLLEFAKKVGCKHFFFADTSAEYDSLTDSECFPTSESMAPNINTPMGFYPITKMAASQFVRSYSKKSAFGSTLFRYTNIYGPSMNIKRDIPPVIGSFTNKMLFEHKPVVIYGDGSKRRDFLHISDLTDFHMSVLDNRGGEIDTKTYNAGSGKNWSIKEIHDLVYKACFSIDNTISHEVEYLPDQLDEAMVTLADISAAERDLSWRPSVSINFGIEDTVGKLFSKHFQHLKNGG